MATVVEIVDPDDVRLRDYLQLTDVALRRVLEPAEGLFMAESATVVTRALGAGYRARSAVSPARWIDDAQHLLRAVDCELYLVPDDVLATVTGYRVHRGVLASMTRKPLAHPLEILQSARVVAMLVDLVDHTNVGAVFRSAAALGVDAVLVSPECADPLYRRSVRVSMGTVFSVPWTRATPWPATLDQMKELGFTTLALTPAPDAQDIATSVDRGRVALLIGSEGPGLRDDVAARCDARVRIPMHAGVDSLNAAAASAVAFYALLQ